MDRTGVVVVACALVASIPARADWQPITWWRTLGSTSAAQPWAGPGNPDAKYTFLQEGGPFTPWNLAYDTQQQHASPDAMAKSLATHTSSWTASTLVARGSGEGEAASEVGGRAQAVAGSGVTAMFALDGPTLVKIDGTLMLDAAGLDPNFSVATAGTYLYRIVKGQAEYVFDHQIKDVARVFAVHFEGLLEPGQYFFAAAHGFNVTADDPAHSRGVAGSYDITVTIPAPGAAGMVGVGVMMLGRRRRRG